MVIRRVCKIAWQGRPACANGAISAFTRVLAALWRFCARRRPRHAPFAHPTGWSHESGKPGRAARPACQGRITGPIHSRGRRHGRHRRRGKLRDFGAGERHEIRHHPCARAGVRSGPGGPANADEVYRQRIRKNSVPCFLRRNHVCFSDLCDISRSGSLHLLAARLCAVAGSAKLSSPPPETRNSSLSPIPGRRLLKTPTIRNILLWSSIGPTANRMPSTSSALCSRPAIAAMAASRLSMKSSRRTEIPAPR